MASTRQRKAGLILAIIGWVSIFLVTLFPIPGQADVSAGTSLWCLVCGELGLVDISLNVILFVPLGLGLGLLGISRVRGFLLIGLTTLVIEVLQLSVVAGRDASLSDLVTNTLGGLLGIWLALHWRHLLFPSRKASLRVALIGGLGWLALQAFTAFAVQRVLPRSVYYGQWAPVLGQFEPFTGEVRSVRLDSIPLPGTRLANSAVVREKLLKPESVLEVQAVSGQPTADVAPIFSIFDDRQREILLIGQEGQDVIYRLRTRTGPLGLRGPALRMAGVLPQTPGKNFVLRARATSGHYHLEASVGGQSQSLDLALSASWGWTLFLPFDHAFGSEVPWLTMLWVGGLLAPLGYFARRGGLAPGGSWFFLIGMMAGGLVLIPIFAGLSLFHPLEWVAGIAGWLAGNWLAFSTADRGMTSADIRGKERFTEKR